MTQPTYTFGLLHTLTLPSGAKVKAKRPSILTLIKDGGFPSELTIAVWRMMKREMDLDALGKDPDAFKQWAALIDAVTASVLVSPAVGEKTDLTADEAGVLCGTVLIGDIPDLDKQFIFLFGNAVYRSDEEQLTEKAKAAQGGQEDQATPRVADLQPFREDAPGGNAGHGGAAIRTEAVGLDRPEGG